MLVEVGIAEFELRHHAICFVGEGTHDGDGLGRLRREGFRVSADGLKYIGRDEGKGFVGFEASGVI